MSSKVPLTLWFVAFQLILVSSKVAFDHTNCMEMKPEITTATRVNSFVLAYAKIYSVYISSSSFRTGSPIRINVKSCLSSNGVVNGMKAFLLQARSLDSKFLPVGYFNTTSLQPDAKAISCYYPYVSIPPSFSLNGPLINIPVHILYFYKLKKLRKDASRNN